MNDVAAFKCKLVDATFVRTLDRRLCRVLLCIA